MAKTNTKIKLMNGDRVIAVEDVDSNNNLIMKLDPNILDEDIPIDLFGYGVNRTNEVLFGIFNVWATDRCFPENRTDKKELLESIGLKEYNPTIIKYFSNSYYVGDTFWVDWGITTDDIKKQNPDKFF